MYKLLISLIFFMGTAAAESVIVEEIYKSEGMITNILTTIHIVTSYDEIAVAYEEITGDELPADETLEGLSDCWRNVAQNIAYCDIWVFESKYVDDEHTLTMGHEVLHGVFGDRYHR